MKDLNESGGRWLRIPYLAPRRVDDYDRLCEQLVADDINVRIAAERVAAERNRELGLGPEQLDCDISWGFRVRQYACGGVPCRK